MQSEEQRNKALIEAQEAKLAIYTAVVDLDAGTVSGAELVFSSPHARAWAPEPSRRRSQLPDRWTGSNIPPCAA